MKPEHLAAIPTLGVAYDCETHLIAPGLLAPPLVCGSIAMVDQDRIAGELLDKPNALAAFQAIIEGRILVAANAPFDMLVAAVAAAKLGIDLMPAIFEAYGGDDPMNGRVFDVQIAETEHAIALGRLGFDTNTGGTMRDPNTGKRTSRYSLETVVRLVLGRNNAKVNDRWRKSYALLEDIPISDWPDDAKIYPVDDAVNTLEACLAQIGAIPASGREHRWPSGGPGSEGTACLDCGVVLGMGVTPPCTARRANHNLHDVSFQCYAHWALHLGAAWGFDVDQDAVNILEAAVNATYDDDIKPFIEAGILRAKLKPDGRRSQDTALIKRMVALAYGANVTCTICTGVGKVESAKQGKPLKRGGFTKVPAVKCVPCDGTGLTLTEIVPRTVPKNPEAYPGVSKGRDTLTESGDELLMDFAVFLEDQKISSVFIPFLRNGYVPEGVEADDESDEDEG